MAGGPAGPVVGRVTIRVAPDASQFRSDLEKELADIRTLDIDLSVEPDLNGLKEKVQAAVKAAEAGARINIPIDVDRSALDRLEQSLSTLGNGIGNNFDDSRMLNALKNIETALGNSNRQITDMDASYQRVAQSAARVRTEVVNTSKEYDKITAALQQQLKDAQAVKLDADITLLQSKLATATAELDTLREHGQDIVVDGEIAPLMAKVKQAEAELTKLGAKRTTPEVQLKMDNLVAEIAALYAQMDLVAGKDWTVTVNGKVDNVVAEVARLQALLAAATLKKHTITIDVDRNTAGSNLNAALSGLFGAAVKLAGNFGSVISKTLSGVFAILPGNLDQIFRAAGDGFRGMASASKTFTDAAQQGGVSAAAAMAGMFKIALSLVQVIATITTSLLTMGALSFALSVAGAGITAAWGAIATVIAQINPAIALIGVPLAAVMLGMDGIKEAFKGLKPEFDALKKSINDTFITGLKPAMATLSDFLKNELKVGLTGTASALSTMAVELIKFVTGAGEIGKVELMFENVNTAIGELTPGIKDVVAGFLSIVAQASAFRPLITVVNEFGAAFKASVTDLLKSGELEGAFTGLSGLLGQLARSFVDLVENGIKTFAAAAPGVTQFLKDLTGFFNQFDWKSLGTSVGDVFKGLGQVLKDVKPETIKGIEEAFKKLAAVFNDPGFQANLQKIIDNLPLFIDLIGRLTSAFGTIAGPAADFIGWIDKALAGWDKLKAAFAGDPAGGPKVEEAIASEFEKGQSPLEKVFGDSLTKTDTWYAALLSLIGVKGGEALQTAGQSTAGAPEAVAQNFMGTPGAVGDALAPTGAAAGTALQDVPTQVTSTLGTIPALILGLAPQIQSSMTQVQAAFGTGWDQVSTNMNTQFQLISSGLAVHLTSFATQVTTSFGTEIQAAFDAGWTAIGTSFATSFTSVLGPALTAGLTALGAVITTGFPATIGLAFTTAFTLLGATFATHFTTLLAPQITLGMAALGLAVTTAFPATIGLAFTTQWGLLAATIGTSFTTVLVPAMTLGMAALAAAVTTGFAPVTLAFTTGFGTTVNAAILAAFNNVLKATITTGMGVLAAEIAAQFDSAIIPAVTAGNEKVNAEWQAGIDAWLATLQAAVPQFTAMGENMGQALADGLRSKVAEVQAAAGELAAAAASATSAEAEINSPSRVFIKLGQYTADGYVVGMANRLREVREMAASIATTAAGAASRVVMPSEDLTTDMTDSIPGAIQSVSATALGEWQAEVSSAEFGQNVETAIANAMDGWGVQIDGNGMAKIVNKSNTRKARRG